MKLRCVAAIISTLVFVIASMIWTWKTTRQISADMAELRAQITMAKEDFAATRSEAKALRNAVEELSAEKRSLLEAVSQRALTHTHHKLRVWLPERSYRESYP